MHDIGSILGISPVIPVITIQENDDVIALANSLAKGGIRIMEITLRTQSGLAAIEQVRREVPGMCVGAGTVWSRDQAQDAAAAGAQFMVSPGIADEVYDHCVESRIPVLPGAQTVSEVAHWVRRGLTAVKFFPAHTAGGVSALKAFSAVFPGLQFCPTGGIIESSAPDYLDLPCVPCVGGSWLTPKPLVASGQWSSIEALARGAVSRLRG
jgi:2-dehydro-3-deoxyphosphogluconate aldolase/(4S)-4-hydroxy-2-oxoglutarate aldolase